MSNSNNQGKNIKNIGKTLEIKKCPILDLVSDTSGPANLGAFSGTGIVS